MYITEIADGKRTGNGHVQYLAKLYPYLSAYIGYYVAIRTGNWALRNGCLDFLAVMFFAYNRPKYEDIVTRALLSRVMLPAKLLEQYEQGEWTVSLKGRTGANLAVDEAHECMINR